jgi:DNA polymerase III subunit alpha
MRKDFVHLHGHSEYSLQDGASRIKDIMKAVDKGGMHSVALTDHGVMYGSQEFYLAGMNSGVKPIIGCELYVCKDRNLRVGGNKKDHDNRTYHLVALAMNYQGYLNLIAMTTEANTTGFYSKPRVDHELIYKYREGIIYLQACLGGEVNSRILKGDLEGAEAMARYYADTLTAGAGHYYLELQDHLFEDPIQRDVNEEIRKIAKKTGIPLVVTNDYHYTLQSHAGHHCAHVCAGQSRFLSDPNKAYATDEFYVKSPEQMWEIFGERDAQALLNTVDIAQRCNVMIEMGQYMLPKFPVPGGFSESSYLRHLSWEGFEKRGLDGDAYRERLNYELDMIDRMGFPGYFLIVSDYIGWARRQGIDVGPGRGSAAGSLVAYCTEITDVDPIRFGLLFERFLNPSRVSMPDIDTDFCIERRGEVIEYVKNFYGDDRVAQIGTVGTLGVKAALKDVCRVMEVDFQKSNLLSKVVPGGDMTFDDPEVMGEKAELRRLYESDSSVKEIVDMAMQLGPRRKDGKKIDGIARNVGIHAAGIIIGDRDLRKVIPMRFNHSSGTDTFVSCLTMAEIERLGLLKMDFLGLRNLTVMRNAVRMIKESTGFEVDIRNLDLDDPKVYHLFETGNLLGVFQVEGGGLTKTAVKLAPKNIEEVCALIALYRPGPLEGGVVDDFINRKHGRQEVVYFDPRMETVTSATYGFMVYQEQIMQIAVVLAGYSLPEADNLRKIIGKKDGDKFPAERAKLVKQFVENGLTEELADKLAEDIAKFARYGFNKSHSLAYSMITYQTAWLKANYPGQYMAALLSSVMDDHEKVSAYSENCRQMGLSVVPPDVNHSGADFTVIGNEIRIGLTVVKGVGLPVVKKLVEIRERVGKFRDMNHFYEEVGVSLCNTKVLDSLIKAGCFDSFGVNRATLLAQYPLIADVYRKAAKKGKKQIPGQTMLFEIESKFVAEPIDLPTGVEKFTRLQELAFEKELIGVYVSGHPLDSYKKGLPYLTAVTLPPEEGEEETEPVTKDGEIIAFSGVLVNTKLTKTKKGLDMMLGEIQGVQGTLKAVIWPSAYEASRSILKEGAFVVAVGKFQNDGKPTILIEQVSPLNEARALVIQVPNKADKGALASLRSSLCGRDGRPQGTSPVVIEIAGSEQHIVAGPSYWCNPSAELIARLERIYRDASIEVRPLI